MTDPTISDESYEILKLISQTGALSDPDAKQFPEACLERLCEEKLIDAVTTEYEWNSANGYFPSRMEYVITDLGKGYLSRRQNSENVQQSIIAQAKSAEDLAKSAKETANSASKLAQIAAVEAKSSAKYAKISLVLSIIATLISGTDLVFRIIECVK